MTTLAPALDATQIADLAKHMVRSDEIIDAGAGPYKADHYDVTFKVGDRFRKTNSSAAPGATMTVIGFSRQIDDYNRSLDPDGVLMVHTVDSDDEDPPTESQSVSYGSPLEMIASMIDPRSSFTMFERIVD